MTKKFSALLLCSILFAFQYAPAQAWEATGHRVVARVADRYLVPYFGVVLPGNQKGIPGSLVRTTF